MFLQRQTIKRDVIIIVICFAIMVTLYFHLPVSSLYKGSMTIASENAQAEDDRYISSGIQLTNKIRQTEFSASTIQDARHIGDKNSHVVTTLGYNERQLADRLTSSFDKNSMSTPSPHKNITLGVLLTDNIGHTGFTASTIQKFHHIDDEDINVVTRLGYNESQLTDWYGKSVNIIAEKSTEMSLRNMLQTFINSRYKILFLVDSSTVFLPSWKDFITQHMINGNVTFLSLYHSSYMHDETNDCQKYVGDLCEGSLQQKLGVAISHEFAELIMSKDYDLFEKYDWNTILKKENVAALYPRKSLVMYIDHTNMDGDYCGETDVPYEFQLCDLPIWVRGGVEFFFDRCTNPQEPYLLGLSGDDAKLKDRMWTKPVISYSLYGGKTRYTDGAITNAKRVFSIYPGWKIWMYIDNSVPDNILYQLCSKNVRFINVTGTAVTNQMSWRFLVAAAPVKMFHILDIDYRILTRGKEAVDEWIKSGRKFHVMRDHPNHSRYQMSGGMWGGLGRSIPNIKELILNYRGNNNYMTDMNFLNGVIWPIVKKSVWVHDSHSEHKFGEDHPFPTESKNGEFVGNVDFS